MKKKKARVIWVGQDTNGRLSGLHYWYRRDVLSIINEEMGEGK